MQQKQNRTPHQIDVCKSVIHLPFLFKICRKKIDASKVTQKQLGEEGECLTTLGRFQIIRFKITVQECGKATYIVAVGFLF